MANWLRRRLLRWLGLEWTADVPAEVRVSIDRVVSEDPDRFAIALAGAFKKAIVPPETPPPAPDAS